jgi:hypothetical protein
MGRHEMGADVFVTRIHLTNRCSQPLAVLMPRTKL